ncbi:MAG: 16S rRNA (adenine(1518)-N(6)/adenine(1519)-N(6))-dimethyltransferase RsmA [Candidatus Aegiribacteria sp.]
MMLLTRLRRNLRKAGLSPDRNLGQNFLVNPSIAAGIAAAVPRGESVLEVGPGFGALTERLVQRCAELTLVEISARMSDFLLDRFRGDAVNVVNSDFLRVDPASLPGFPFAVLAGNLPYSISSPILFRLLEDGFRDVRTAVLMLQREVAARLAALDGGKDYGKLSLQFWPLFLVETLLDAGPEDFYPVPEVHSRVVVLKRREEPLLNTDDFAVYRRLVKVSFSMRRKTILNNLKAALGRDEALALLKDAGVAPGRRAEQIPPDKFLSMAEKLS